MWEIDGKYGRTLARYLTRVVNHKNFPSGGSNGGGKNEIFCFFKCSLGRAYHVRVKLCRSMIPVNASKRHRSFSVQ